MTSPKARINIYLTEELDRRLNGMSARAINEFGRRSGRSGGWHSLLIGEALASFDVEAWIEQRKNEQRQRQADESQRKAA